MSLLEAALATAMLAIVGMALLAAVQSIWRQQLRQEQTLGAAELANRLILIYLDNDTRMPPDSLPVEYGPYRFRWKLTDERVSARLPDGLSSEARRRREERANRATMDRFRSLTIRVWLSEENKDGGGSFQLTAAAPQFELTRLYDPLNFKRNPDTVKQLNADPERLIRLLSGALGGGQPSTGPAPEGGSGGGGRRGGRGASGAAGGGGR